MLRHTVLFRLSDPALRDEVVEQLAKLEGNVPGLRAVDVRANALDGPGTYHVQLTADFDDAAGFGSYVQHDFHQQVWERVQPSVTDVAAIQVDAVGTPT